jgi:methylase of polypeptide subunit release factors
MIDVTEGAAHSPPPLVLADTSKLRTALAAAGFTAEGVRSALAVEGQVLGQGVDELAHEHRLAAAPPAQAALIRLLILGGDADPGDVDEALLEQLARHRVVEERAGRVRGVVRIVPHDELLIASDILAATQPDHVAAVHRPSAALANLTVRRRVRRGADIGTGNGVQALLCASHCDRVVATDINERALAFAEFNAALNGIGNIEFRAGSFLEPVAGERFDLVVSNPPYVISPESSLIFRDSGLPGDAVSAQLVSDLPSHLDDDGFATVMISWAADDDVLARPSGWLAGSGCDAWLIHTAPDSPLEAALAWNRPAGDPDVIRTRVDEWVGYYERLGFVRIVYGALVLNRRAGDNWFRAGSMPAHAMQRSAALLERLFAADLDDVLDRPLSLVSTVVVERSAHVENGTWEFLAATAELREGIGFGVNLDAVGAAVIECFDGRAPLRDRLPQVASSLGLSVDQLTPFAEALARHLVEHGFAV